ncbi:hypothetical protein [Streptomyces sp. NPDC127197]|uniref:hypothetical protein n=1 Tax=Streptomyces sp. NPDC127197 TaxID=3345388 RepID=UPI00363E6223
MMRTDSEHDTVNLPARGDLTFVYDGPGLATRLEGWAISNLELFFGDGLEAARQCKVAAYRNADGNLGINARVTPLAVVAAWHLVNPAGNVVNGGPRGRYSEKPSQTQQELEAVRDSGRYESHKGAVPVYGIPSTSWRSPSADANRA